MRVFALLGFLAVTSTALAQSPVRDVTVFGLPLGSPFNVVPCRMKGYMPDRPKGADVCFFGLDVMNPQLRQAPKTGDVYLSFSNWPPVVSGFRIVATLQDGKFEGLSFRTKGVSDAEYVLAELQKKYGAPTALNRTVLQNGYGAKYNGLTANWRFSELQVEFDAPEYKQVDEGKVSIRSQRLLEARSAAAKKVPAPRSL